MKPKQAVIDRAVKNGCISRVNKLLSLSHILLCTSNQYLEEASDELKTNGMLIGGIKKLHNDFLKKADNYFREFAKMITDQESKMDMFRDMESLDTIIRKWSRIDEKLEANEK